MSKASHIVCDSRKFRNHLQQLQKGQAGIKLWQAQGKLEVDYGLVIVKTPT